MNTDKEPLTVVPFVDLTRYAGRWYEIARLPMRFEEDCVSDVTATYTLRADGTIGVANACRNADGEFKRSSGTARLADKSEPNSKLQVTFLPPFLQKLPFVWADYWIIELDEDYRWSVVGEPGRKFYWVLSRTPQLDEEDYQGILARSIAQGYDLGALIKTQHTR